MMRSFATHYRASNPPRTVTVTIEVGEIEIAADCLVTLGNAGPYQAPWDGDGDEVQIVSARILVPRGEDMDYDPDDLLASDVCRIEDLAVIYAAEDAEAEAEGLYDLYVDSVLLAEKEGER